MSYRIFLVEDEVHLNQILCSYLEKEGWSVRSFLTGAEAQRAIPERPHLWILDIMLPDIDGYQLIREIKAASPDASVIFISARDADLDRVIGLELGSDDYLAKPFLPRELVIRTRNLLERTYGKASEHAPGKSSAIFLPPYAIHPETRMATEHDREIELTSKEFDLLLFFAAHLNQAFSREQILTRVWGDDYFGSDRVVDDLVRRLRRKMPELRLETIYGFGYRLVKS